MTQEQLAEAANLSQKRISQIEGHREEGYLPPLDNLRALAGPLQCSVRSLVDAAGYRDDEETSGPDLSDPFITFWLAHADELSPDLKQAIMRLVQPHLKR